MIAKIECCSSKYVLTNVYAPSQHKENEQIRLIDTLQTKLAIFEGENIIIGGDFNNILLDLKVDNNGSSSDLNKSVGYRMALNNFWDYFYLCDIWKLNNMNKHMFTLCNRKN